MDAMQSDLLQDFDAVLTDIREHWSPGMKAGKLLSALAGRVQNYDPRVTRTRNALKPYRLLPYLEALAEEIFDLWDMDKAPDPLLRQVEGVMKTGDSRIKDIRQTLLAAPPLPVAPDPTGAMLQVENASDNSGHSIAKAAFDALVAARYSLVEKDASLGNEVMRFTFKDPKDAPSRLTGEDGRSFDTITLAVSSDMSLGYSPEFVADLSQDELIGILACFALQHQCGFNARLKDASDQDHRTMLLAMSLIANAVIAERGIGCPHRHAPSDPRITARTTLDEAMVVAREIEGKVRG